MLGIERRQKIIEIMQRDGKVYVAKLAKEFGITEETVRRDLEKLEGQQLLQRSYGGAIPMEKATEDISFDQRSITNVEEKKILTNKAIKLVEDGDTIFIDASSTALLLRPHLEQKKNITIITNSVRLLYDAALNTNLRILSTGGNLKNNSFALNGPIAQDAISKFTVDLAIISCKALSQEYGAMESTVAEASLKKVMLSRARKKILLVDHHKFDKTAFVHICNLKEFSYIVTDRKPSPEWCRIAKQENIGLIY